MKNKLASQEVKEALDQGYRYPSIGDVIESEKLKFEGHTEWIVVDTRMTGGKIGLISSEYIPDGYQIVIQQLNPDGSYNEKGFIYKVYMTGSFENKIPPDDVKIVRRMKKIFV